MLSWLATKRLNRSRSTGFTLVEVAVVIPIAILLVIGLVVAMITITGDVLESSARSEMNYDASSALSRIEQDTRRSYGFASSFGDSSIAPQGKDDASSQFIASSGDLILESQATTKNPISPDRGLIFYADQPNTCSSPEMIENATLDTRIVYFIKSVGDQSSLWRRTIVDPYNQNATPDADTVCDKPWQRNSCSPGVTGTRCQASDEQLANGVENLAITYYTPDGSTTSFPAEASSIKIELTLGKSVAGKDITKTVVLRAAKITIIDGGA